MTGREECYLIWTNKTRCTFVHEASCSHQKARGDGVSRATPCSFLLRPLVNAHLPPVAVIWKPRGALRGGGVVYEGRPILESNDRWKGEIQTTRAWQFPSNHDPSSGQDSCASLRHGSLKFDSRIMMPSVIGLVAAVVTFAFHSGGGGDGRCSVLQRRN